MAVTEMRCEIVPYTNCTMKWENTKYRSYEDKWKWYVEKKCWPTYKVIKHDKLMPKCRNITKQNCVTLWKTGPNGEQVQFIMGVYVTMGQLIISYKLAVS